MSPSLLIRAERSDDVEEVYEVNKAAFPTPAEAELVSALRERATGCLSLIAEVDGEIVGHIFFSPVTLTKAPHRKIAGLAPMAVLPKFQRKGIGTALAKTGLERCRQMGYEAVVVLGHPEFYPRFGFVPASRFGIRCEFEVPDEAFMIAELQAGALRETSGTACYHPAFADV